MNLIIIIISILIFIIVLTLIIVQNTNNTNINEPKNQIQETTLNESLLGTRFGIFVRSRNEENVVEFISYYLSIGFTFFCFFDDFSEPSIQEVIDNSDLPSFKYNIIRETIPGRSYYGEQYSSPGMFNKDIFKPFVLPVLQKETDFVLSVDMDEYLHISKPLVDILRPMLPFSNVQINWLYFGNQNIKKCQDHSSLLKFQRSDEYLFEQYKSLGRTENIVAFFGPHQFMYKPGITNRGILDSSYYTPRRNFKMTTVSYKDVPMYIAHYFTQDTETYLKRRYLRNTENVGFGNDKINYFKENFEDLLDHIHGSKNIKFSKYQDYIDRTKRLFDIKNRNNNENKDLIRHQV
jgi:hypothetical protein